MDVLSGLGGHSTATALIDRDQRTTYAELADRTRRTASGLRARGITLGARVAIMASATTDTIVAFLGAQAAGLLPVMLSPRSTRAELQRRFDDVDPALVLLGTASEVELPDGVPLLRPAGTGVSDGEVLDGEAGPVADVGADTPAVVLYTSGVAGLPRPVVLTHGNLASTRQGLIGGPGAGLDASTVALAGLPLAHVFGLNSVVGTVLAAGGEVVLADGLEPGEVAELIARHRVTAVSAVPLQWKAFAMLGRGELFSTVGRATWSAAPMPPAVVSVVEERLRLRLAGGFGLTETSGTICQDDPSAPTLGTVGQALGATEVRIVDDDGDVLPGDFGELWVNGPSVVRSYLDGSPTALTPDGWLRTGDVAVFDDEGRVGIVDRSKEVINVGGFNVSPSEVEDVLGTHPGVATSVVVGDVEDDREVVVAHVVARPGSHVTEAELIDHCQRQLSRYKVPRHVLLHDELPLTDSGKPVRRLLGTA